MTNIDDVFAAIPDAQAITVDDSVDFVIDSNLRVISIPTRGVVLGVEGDKDVNRVTFLMPKIYKGVDMSAFQIRVNYANANGEKNFFKVTETSVANDQIRFIWVVAADAVAYMGNVEFVVRFVKLNGSTVVQELNTTLATAKSLVGLSVDGEITQVQREDLLAHFYSEMDTYSEKKKNEILGSIPDDYQVLDEKIKNVVREKGNETESTKISYDGTGDEYEVPDMEEFNKLKSDIDDYPQHHTVIFNSNVYGSRKIIVGKWIGVDGKYNSVATCNIARIPVCGGNTLAICYNGITNATVATELGGYILLDKNQEKIALIKADDYISTKKYKTYPTFSIPIPKDCYFIDITVKLATSWDATNDLIVIYGDAFDTYDGTNTDIYSWDGKTIALQEQHERKKGDAELYARLKDGAASDTEIVGDPIFTNVYNSATDIIKGHWISNDGTFKPVSSCAYAKVKINYLYNYTYILLSLGLNKKVNAASNSMGGILFQNELGENVGDTVLAENCEKVQDYNGDYCIKIPIPNGAKYILITVKMATTFDASNTLSVREVTDLENKKIKKIFGCNLYTKPQWKGKKWVAFGDSLTEANLRTTMHYHNYIADETGITVINFGSSGTGYKRTESEGKAFYQRMQNIPTDIDVLTIFGSGNDLNYTSMGFSDFNSVLGTPKDTTTETICGCVNKTIDVFLEKCPTTNIGIITPTPWQGYNPANAGNSMELYANALITICKNRGIPCLDLYHCSNLRPWDASFRKLAYSKDDGGGTHPDETGHKMIAPRFKAFLETLVN